MKKWFLLFFSIPPWNGEKCQMSFYEKEGKSKVISKKGKGL